MSWSCARLSSGVGRWLTRIPVSWVNSCIAASDTMRWSPRSSNPWGSRKVSVTASAGFRQPTETNASKTAATAGTSLNQRRIQNQILWMMPLLVPGALNLVTSGPLISTVVNSSLNPAEKRGSIQRIMENVRLIAVTGQVHFGFVHGQTRASSQAKLVLYSPVPLGLATLSQKQQFAVVARGFQLRFR